VEAEYSSGTFVALNQNAMRHISGGTDLVELHILKFECGELRIMYEEQI